MKLFGHNRSGRPQCSTKPRTKTKKTKAEKRLERRITSYNASANTLGITNARADGYHRPGSLQYS